MVTYEYFEDIMRSLDEAFEFISLPSQVADIMTRKIDRKFIRDRKCAYKIQPDDDGVSLFDIITDGIRDVVRRSKGGVLAGYNYMTTVVVPTVNDEQYETMNHTKFQPIYLVFTENKIVLISQNNVGLKFSSISITLHYLKSTRERDIEYKISYSKKVSIFIDVLSTLNHIRYRNRIIQHRMCLRKSLGLGR